MHPIRLASALLIALQVAWAGEPLLVENGVARAEIILSETPTRSQRLAAQEFRDDIEKISGARLPIVNTPSGKMPCKVFIGRSKHTDTLGIPPGGLKYGAYRITTGADWMALIGDDSDFTPIAPYAQNNSDIKRAQKEWEGLTGSPWGMPNMGLYKHRIRLPGDTGKPDGAITAKNETLDLWGLDERGSFNAVCAFMHKLGARWYLPGELGEVMPTMKTIVLPRVDETIQPDFMLRQFNFRFGTVGPLTAKWAMRLGIRNDDSLQIAHGMATMTGNEATFSAHPEWFALYGGKRDIKPGSSKNQLCYSNDELFQETVRWARAQLDTYHFRSVSIMPPDGYGAICECDKCKGKASPERDRKGLLSDYVWDFVNRVAKEIGKTHPHAKVLNCAYGTYTLPPLKIRKLEPNVLVCIVGGRRPMNGGQNMAIGENEPTALREAWLSKSDNPILNFENYPFTDRGWYLPAFAAHALGDSLNATKGMSQGEDIWLTVRNDFDKSGIGFNHFLVYFTARMQWGGRNADSEAILKEYCRLFYGPAEKEILSFFNFCEVNWAAMEADKTKADEALALFGHAKDQTDATSIYGRRFALIDDFLKGLRMKSDQLGQKRGPVPAVRMVGDASGIVIDGQLDDAYWLNCPIAATGKFRELETGRLPTLGTSYKAGWQGNSLYLAIRCDERLGEKPNITTIKDGDDALWRGDAVIIQVATETHSYYTIAVNPSGASACLDRGAPNGATAAWDAQAEISTRIADGYWTIELRLPVTQDENDPLHQIIGRKPTQSLPWHINLCRQRIRADGIERSALSPTGTDRFDEPMKFAHFYDGRSHPFVADPSVRDFATALRDVGKLRPLSEALKANLALTEGKLTDFQKSAALEQAASIAISLKNFNQATDLAAQIPVAAVRKTVVMQNLIAQGKALEVVAQFATEDIEQWPFWKRGDGYLTRGRAFVAVKKPAQAENDLTHALAWLSDERSRKTAQQGLQALRTLK
jgi:hypothetical protein